MQFPACYTPIQENPSDSLKQENDILVQNMFANGEISEPVADFL